MKGLTLCQWQILNEHNYNYNLNLSFEFIDMENVSEWQHPFVDVFKKYNTFDAAKSFKGSVTIIHDPTIARKSFKITGSILSNNTVTIPDPNGEVKACNLIGRYLYIQFLASPQKYFCIHFQIGIRDREPGVRFTFTNMEKDYSISGGNTLKIPFQSEGRNLWTIACIDIEHHLENYGLFSKGAIKNYSGCHILKGIQICSNLIIRGIYTSSNVYDWNSLPKELAFKIVKGGRWEDNYNFIYLPASINPVEVRRKLKEQEVQPPKEFPNSIVEREEISTNKKRRSQNISSINESNKVIGVLPSDSFLQLTTAFSFSSLHNPDLIFKNDKVYYSAGSILIRKDINTGQQIFMQGHTDYIVAMDCYNDWIVTVQEGNKSSVRIWIDHKCISSFQCPYQKVQQIRLSNKKHLVMVGLDPYKRQAILIFDISQIETNKEPKLLAKQISDFNILTIKFSPVESDKLVSCGKENIRFWRVKNQHLPGSPVVLNHHARNTIFTVLDFEYSYDDPNPLKQRSQIKRVYVGSQNGLLFQINYATHEFQEVYKLHDNAAISSLVVSSGFCVTGGEDQLLRVWQMDFSQYILEANNDGVVTSLTLSEDASQVACGTSTGVLSILDLTNNNYRTIVRSHTENVGQIVYHTFSNCILSLSSDLTIRLWDPEKLEQTYQFSYPSNDNCLCLTPNPQGLYFAAGFQSGVLRIFDIENTCVIEEIKHHENPILHIQYSPDGRYLAVLEQKLNMLYSPLHSHQPIKHLPSQIPSKYKHSCFSEDSETIAIIGDSGTHINLWQLRSLQLSGKIFTGKVIKKLKFDEEKLWVIFEDTSIRRYNIVKMTIEVEMQALHRNRLNSIDFEHNSHLLFSVGDDSFVKVWDYSFLRQPHQVYIGHAKNINDVLYHNGKLWTAGSQGILVWNFEDHGEKFVEPPIFLKQKKAPFIKNVQQAQSMLQEKESKINQELSNINAEDENSLAQTIKQPPLELSQNENKIVFSNLIKKTFENDAGSKFVPQKILSNFQSKNVAFKKTKKREGKPKLTADLPKQNIELSLPLKHFFQENLGQSQLQYTRKIQEIKQHNKKYKLEYFMGIESTAHDHIVWNFMYGWYAYIYDNLIIVQSLNKARSQRIITMPEKLASLALTKDYKKLICSSEFNFNRKAKVELGQSAEGSDLSSSSIEQGQQNSTANIYILAGDFTIERKLQFHPRGIQSMKLSDNGKYIVSIGNFRQCTVCVWDFQLGKLKASSYTLDKLNDVAILKVASEGRLLQFATVGRDQIHFWTFTKDEKLQYYDLFIKPEEEEQLPEITSCDYLTYHDTNYLVFGTSKGELGIVNIQNYKVTWRKKVCSAEILTIKCCLNNTILGVNDGNLYFWNYNTNLLQSQPTPSFNKLNLYYSVNGIFVDEEGHEGVISTSEAIYYVNLTEQFHSLLVGSPSSPVIFMKIIGTHLLTSHQNARLKLWNLETAQQLKTYKWKFPCTEAYFDESLGKLVCFCANQSLKLVNLKKFTKEETYVPEDFKPDGKLDDFVINSSMVAFGGRPSRWNFYSKGNVFSFELTQEGKKKSIKGSKVLELGYKVNEVTVNPEKNIIIACASNGTVYSYNVDYSEEAENPFSLLMVDKAASDEFSLEKKPKVESSTEQEKTVKIALSKILNQTYLAINFDSQCVYFRNYMKRITFQRITLPSFPTSILMNENKKESQFIVGLKEGAIMKINTLELEQRLKYEGIANNSVDNIIQVKNKNWLILAHPSAMAIYSPDQ